MELTGNSHQRRSVRKLLSTRRGTALVAGVCTVVAAGVLLFAASKYRHSVSTSGLPETVLVASSLIQKGTPGDVIAQQTMFRPEQILTKQVTAGAIADASALRGKVAATDINPGQQLTLADFTASTGYVSDLAPGQRAIAVPLDASHGLTGVVKAGDRVDVYAGVNADVNTRSQTTSASVALRLMASNVSVLAVNLNSAGGGLGNSNGVDSQADVLLKVPASEAGALAFASDNGKVWLVLRGANAVEPRNQKTLLYTYNSLLLGSKPATGGKP